MWRRELLLALLAGGSNARRRMQDVMGRLPRLPRRAPAWRVLSEERASGYVRRRIAYTAEPGDEVPAWLLLPAGAQAGVLCLHQTTRAGKDEPAGLAGNPDLHYAHELARRGFAVLAPDYPNFGDYRLDVYARGYASATMKGIVNHRRGLDLLTSFTGARRLGVAGHSLGGHNALFLGAFDERAYAVVSSCGFTSFRRYHGGDLTGWSHAGYMPRIASVYGKDPARMPFDFSDVLACIAPRALFINAPLRDGNFDVAGVQECIAAVRARFQRPESLVVRHPDAEHSFPAAVRQDAYGFLERWLLR